MNLTAVLSPLRPARILRVGPYALLLNDGLLNAGWSPVFWRLWRYREADERRYLELTASVYGLASLPGESIAHLRERITNYVREMPLASAGKYPFGGGDAA
jgi:hypothetical protein